jgi:hypothetical protein
MSCRTGDEDCAMDRDSSDYQTVGMVPNRLGYVSAQLSRDGRCSEVLVRARLRVEQAKLSTIAGGDTQIEQTIEEQCKCGRAAPGKAIIGRF